MSSKASPLRIAITLLLISIAWPVTTMAEEHTNHRGNVDFKAADLPPANIEVDLTDGIFRDVFGLLQSAMTGASSAISDSGDDEAMQFVVKQLEELKTAIPHLGEVIQEVRVRIYEDQDFGAILPKLRSQMNDEWQRIVRVRSEDANVHVSLLRSDESIQGVLVVVADPDDSTTIVANVACDISPERAEILAKSLTKIGLATGLKHELHKMFEHMHN